MVCERTLEQQEPVAATSSPIRPNRGPSDLSIVQVRRACSSKCKLQGSERSNCMGNTLKIRIFTMHTLHFYMVVTTMHNKYMCIFHWG